MQGGIPPCIPEVLGTCYSVWMTVWYAGWNSTLHTRSTRYLLFCVDDSGMQGGIPPCIPDSHPHRITSTECHINTDVSPDDGHTVARNM